MVDPQSSFGPGVMVPDGAGEFGFRFPELSVEFLREKAKNQLRDALGRWRKMRGRLGDSTGRVGPVQRANLDAWRVKSVEIAKDGIVDELVRAGFSVDAAGSFAERGRVFRYSDNGKNAIYTFFVNSDDAANSRIDGINEELKESENTLKNLESLIESHSRRGRKNASRIKTLESKLNLARMKHEGIKRKFEREADRWKKLHGHNDLTTSERYIAKLSDDAGELLEDSVSKMPDWKRNSTRAFMVEFDESVLMSAGIGLVPAQAERGGNKITLHRGFFYNSTSLLPENHAMPTGARTFGEYTIKHESGHLIDERDISSPTSSMKNQDVWEEAVEMGLMSSYGKSNPREGYAEAYAMWQHDPGHPIAVLYNRRFNWDGRQSASPFSNVPYDDYWEQLLEKDPEQFIIGSIPKNEPFVRYTGNRALSALIDAGFTKEQAGIIARSGVISTKDGKTWALQRTSSEHGSDPRTAPSDKLHARRALSVLSQWVRYLPEQQEGPAGPYLVEISRDFGGGAQLSGATIRGSYRIILNSAVFEVDGSSTMDPDGDSVQFAIMHALGHLADNPRNMQGSSSGPVGSLAFSLARDFPGAEEFRTIGPEEAYAETFRRWMLGLTGDQSVDFYNYVFRWSSGGTRKQSESELLQNIERWVKKNNYEKI